MTMKSRPVSMFSPEGKILARFPSVRHANMIVPHADQSHIRKVCRGDRNQAGGFSWRYIQRFSENRLVARIRGIRQYNADNELIGLYANATVAAELTGISEKTISRALQTGRRNQGFYWK